MFHQGHIYQADAPPFAQNTHLLQDLVCKFIQTPIGRKRVILVPKPLRPILLYLVHDECGHSSAPYALKRLQENWLWDGMTQDVSNFCKSCNTCAKSKPPHKYNRLPLEPMEPSAREFGDRIHIDLLSMPRSADGHVAICTAVDAATGFVFATPCMDKTSTSVTQLLQQTIIPYFGCPKVIVTDLGVENKNSEVEQLLRSYKIQHITSSRACLLYTSPSPRDKRQSRMPSSA